MKRIITYMLGLLLAVSSCSVDNDYIYGDISSQRLADYVTNCDKMLTEEEHGWKFIYYPDEDRYGAYTFLMKFSKMTDTSELGTRVMMMSDLYIEPDGAIRAVPDSSVSSYGYAVSLGPVLSFNTYSLLHYLGDPNPDVYGGKAGIGFGAEFEFIIDSVDTQNKVLKLLGKKHKRAAEMVPATAEDWVALQIQKEVIKNFLIDNALPFYHYLVVGGDTAFFNYSPTLRMAYLAYVKDGKTIAENYPAHSTMTGVKFKFPAVFGGLEFDEITFNKGTNLIDIINHAGEYITFRAAKSTDNCLIRFPEAVNMAQAYADGFSLVERGVLLTVNNTGYPANDRMNLFPGGYDIKEFRFYWNLIGQCAGEIYCHPYGFGVATYAGLYRLTEIDSTYGDIVHFEKILQTYYGGDVQESMNNWFNGLGGFNAPPISFGGGGDTEDLTTAPGGGTLKRYMDNKVVINGDPVNRGHTVIPVGGQFYMIHVDRNNAWALYTPKVDNVSLGAN